MSCLVNTHQNISTLKTETLKTRGSVEGGSTIPLFGAAISDVFQWVKLTPLAMDCLVLSYRNAGRGPNYGHLRNKSCTKYSIGGGVGLERAADKGKSVDCSWRFIFDDEGKEGGTPRAG